MNPLIFQILLTYSALLIFTLFRYRSLFNVLERRLENVQINS